MKQSKKWRILSILGLMGLYFLGLGCSASGPKVAEDTGVLKLPLMSWSSEGTRYKLSGTFTITGPENHSLQTTGLEPELSLALTAGTYQVKLESGWFLQRVDESGNITSEPSARLTVSDTQTLVIENQVSATAHFEFAVGPDALAFGKGKGSIGVKVKEPAQPLQVTARSYHTCALWSGKIACWGKNGGGQLGYGHQNAIGDNELPYSAGLVSLGGRAKAITAGGSHTCALMDSGYVRCWGLGSHGQLGYGTIASIGDNEHPTYVGFVSLGAKSTAISAGTSHTCALLESGDVKCWGYNSYGQLGYGHSNNIGDNELPSSVGVVSLGGKAKAIAAGANHTCALMDSGSVRCWGRNNYGQLGYGHTRDIGASSTPRSMGFVNLGAKATALTAGEFHTCALMESGDVRCWGSGSYGQLGYGHQNAIGDDELPSSVGVVSLDGAKVTAISAGRFHTCALLHDRKLKCWGLGSSGQLGYGNTLSIGDNERPNAVGHVPIEKVLSIATGGYHTCAVIEGNGLRCWGNNTYGQLGIGSIDHMGDNEPVLQAGFALFR